MELPYFRKTLHLRFLIGFWISLCNYNLNLLLTTILRGNLPCGAMFNFPYTHKCQKTFKNDNLSDSIINDLEQVNNKWITSFTIGIKKKKTT